MPRLIATRFLFLILFTCAALAAQAAEAPLVPARSVWKYLDNGTDQGTAWREVAFDDSSWASGFAELGYGDGDEATVVSYGPDPLRRYITTYFRQSFQVSDPAVISSLRVRLIRDDGAVVYINGTEVWRSNMPSTTIGYRTVASTTVSDEAERTWYETMVSSSLLQAGTNVVAVEVHQAGASSSDLSFALELLGDGATPTPNLTRGPYLQQGTPNSMIVRWRTDLASDSRVRYGTSPGSLTLVADDPTVTTEHIVRITGLTPATKYYYAVETTTARVGGGDSSFYFVTSPAPGAATPARIWVLGDSGTGNSNAAAVRDAYYNSGGRTSTNLVLLLGDNAYNSGYDEEYQRTFFNMYPDVLRTAPVWPTIGNHETAQLPNPSPAIPYFDIFTLPTQGEVGGMPSGTEHYYSFDYGNVHFICLDSMASDRSPTGPMLTWLRDDLASTAQPWIVAYWHHPPYSKGSHDSDRSSALIDMRRNAGPILEEGGVDLVLSGHSHSYERSYLIHGHYGDSTTLTSSMKIDGGDGRVDGTGAYSKKTTETSSSLVGTVYAVSGSAGLTGGGTLNHPAMFVSLNELGSMILDVDGPRLHATFLRDNGTVGDRFTLDKSGTATPSAPAAVTATATSATSAAVSWTDTSSNETGFRVERCTGSGCTSFAAVTQTTATSFADGSLAASTTYRYRVFAYNTAGDSAASNIADVTTPAASNSPAAPTNLDATAVSSTQIQLSWADNSTNETAFRVERCSGASCTGFAAVAQTTSASFADSGLTAGTLYRYRVVAFNDSGDSAPSNVAEATTVAAAPAAASGLTATAVSPSQIDLAWTDNSTDETGFRIERCSGAACTNFAAVAETTGTSYSDSGLAPSTTYRYRVYAFNSAGDAPASNLAGATTQSLPPPAAPSHLAATTAAGPTVNLTWNDNSANEDGFRILRCSGQNCSSFVDIASVGANVRTYSDPSVSRNTWYRYRVIAYNGGGNSLPSNTVTVRTPNR